MGKMYRELRGVQPPGAEDPRLPNRAQRRAQAQHDARVQRRGQRAYNRTVPVRSETEEPL